MHGSPCTPWRQIKQTAPGQGYGRNQVERENELVNSASPAFGFTNDGAPSNLCDLSHNHYGELDMINALEATLPAVHAEAFSAEAANGMEGTGMILDGKLIVGLQLDLSHNRLMALNFGVQSDESATPGKNVYNISPSSGGGSSVHDFSYAAGLSAAAVAAFRSTTALDISSNALTTLEGFEAMPLLSVLVASDNAVKETTGLWRNKHLTQLDLSRNPIRFVEGLHSLSNLEVLDVSGCQIPSTSGIRSLGMSKSLTTLYVGDTPLARVLSRFSAHLRNLFPHVAVVDGSLRPLTDAHAADGEAFEGDSIASASVSVASPSIASSGAGSTANEAGRKRNARHRRRMEALEEQRGAARSRTGSRPGSRAGSQGQAPSERNGALAGSTRGLDSSARTKGTGRVAQRAQVHTKPKPRERTYAAMHKKRLSSPGSDGVGAKLSPTNMEENAPVAETLGLVPPSSRKAPVLTTMATPRAAPQEDQEGLDVTILHHSTSQKGGISDYMKFDEDEFGYMDDPFDDEDKASQEYEYRMRSLPWRRPPNPIPRGWLELHVTGHGLQNPSSAGFGEPPPPPPMALTVNGGGFKPVFRGSSFNNRQENKSSGGDGARHLVNNWNVHQVAEKTKAANLIADRARSTPRALAKSARTSTAFVKSPYSDAKHLNNRLWREKRESTPRYAKGNDTLASTSRTIQTDLGKSDATRSIRRGGIMGSAHDNGSRTRGASVANIYSPRTSSSSPRGFSRRLGAQTVRRSSDEANIDTPNSMRSVSRKIGFAGAFRKSAVKTAPPASPHALPEVPPELKTARKILAAAAHSMGGQDFAALLQRVGKGNYEALDIEEFQSMVRQVLNLPASIVTDDEVEGVFQLTGVDMKGTIRMNDFISLISPPDENALNEVAHNEMEGARGGDQQQLHRQFSPVTIQTTSEITSYPGRDVLQHSANDGGHLARVSTDPDAISEISHSLSILQGQERVAENVDDEDIMRRWPISPRNSIGARLSLAGDGPLSNVENMMRGPVPSSVEAYYDQVSDHADSTAEAGAESNTSILKILQAVIAAKRETIRKLQLQGQSQPPIQRDAASPSTHHTADTTF